MKDGPRPPPMNITERSPYYRNRSPATNASAHGTTRAATRPRLGAAGAAAVSRAGGPQSSTVAGVVARAAARAQRGEARRRALELKVTPPSVLVGLVLFNRRRPLLVRRRDHVPVVRDALRIEHPSSRQRRLALLEFESSKVPSDSGPLPDLLGPVPRVVFSLQFRSVRPVDPPVHQCRKPLDRARTAFYYNQSAGQVRCRADQDAARQAELLRVHVDLEPMLTAL